ncbi:hypothetical protein R3W88_008742 [Solanum pinnatisectum]|uniref:RNase H type-1 domain-containing protein n=1 Tax=Solanum pinnatisectum TaxID=50273 RepID=A0AAV9M999_9SOLN|nr:hypothetical protein R3W88_008742 [Solanum pinnatisectum]
MNSWNSNISPNCRCCSVPERETSEHLFQNGEVARVVWQYFNGAAGINHLTYLKQSIRKWWDTGGNARVKVVFQVVPMIILWVLWKRRNTILHGGIYSTKKSIRDANDIIRKLIVCRFKIKWDIYQWSDMVVALEGYIPSYSFRIVRWSPPSDNWFECNTDGASRGNPGPSSAAFCIRDSLGHLVVAKGIKIQDTTTLVAGARAIRECMEYCKVHRVFKVIIESDSIAMVQILEGTWKAPWSVVLEVDYIKKLRRTVSARVQHSLLEGNTLADFFLT